jgi:hypothetical protein
LFRANWSDPMPLVRRLMVLALTVVVLVTGVAAVTPSAFAQDPANQGQAKGKDKATASKKKPARRKPNRNGAVGAIVPYPFPPVLIIRQTPEAHDEIQAFLFMLRYY